MKKQKFKSILPMLGLLILTYGIVSNASGQQMVKQGNPVPAGFCISSTVTELYNAINEYRQHYDLPPVVLSKSLCYVAALHAKDLALHHPDQGPCNFHSWSGKSFWKPFCYPRDENKKNSVWDKPRELTPYPDRAYEIVYWENTSLIADTVIMVWKTEAYFNSFLLNNGKWQGKEWNAIGIALYENYACAWFGEVPDPEGAAVECGTAPPVHKPDTLKSLPIKKKNLPADSRTVKDEIPVPKPLPPVKVKPEEAVVHSDTTKIYYIIVKTNLSMEAATRLVNSLKAKDYPDARVIHKDDKVRVSVFESPFKPVVTAKLREVKQTYKDAWLFKN
ncbi:MAG: CAP domain-containing protein [Bacteroidota bacterium]